MSLKSTPLRDEHVRLGAKMVDFAGWYMPVSYAGLREEHMTVRSKVGLFDVSHMGEIRIKGAKALETAEWLTTNWVGKLENGQAQYSLLPNADGGLVDDIIVYCVEKGSDYLVCVNASNADKDFAWMKQNNRGAELINESDKWAQIAVQGPLGLELAARVCGPSVKEIAPFNFRSLSYAGGQVLVARTGYTGEDGVEIFVPSSLAVPMWKDLLTKGADLGVMPIGLGARDTLRTEARFSLYGHEIDEHINPYSAGLGWVIKPDKKDFIGRGPIVAGKERGLTTKLIGLKMNDRGIARQGYKIFSTEGKEIGFVTSGTPSPSLNENIAIGYVETALANVGQKINVEIRGKMNAAEIVATPFVKKK